MQTTEGFELVEGEGYCLWVGAGVSIHLSGVGGRPRTPNWSDLAKQMEEEAQLTPLNANLSFPDRFERMRRARGFEWFQSKLREKVLCRLSASVTEATSDLYVSALIELGLVLFALTIIINALARLLLLTTGDRIAK